MAQHIHISARELVGHVLQGGDLPAILQQFVYVSDGWLSGKQNRWRNNRCFCRAKKGKLSHIFPVDRRPVYVRDIAHMSALLRQFWGN
jgi:hypothetical protein